MAKVGRGRDPLYQRDVTCGLLLQARPATSLSPDMWKYEVVCQQSEVQGGRSELGGSGVIILIISDMPCVQVSFVFTVPGGLSFHSSEPGRWKAL